VLLWDVSRLLVLWVLRVLWVLMGMHLNALHLLVIMGRVSAGRDSATRARGADAMRAIKDWRRHVLLRVWGIKGLRLLLLLLLLMGRLAIVCADVMTVCVFLLGRRILVGVNLMVEVGPSLRYILLLDGRVKRHFEGPCVASSRNRRHEVGQLLYVVYNLGHPTELLALFGKQSHQANKHARCGDGRQMRISDSVFQAFLVCRHV